MIILLSPLLVSFISHISHLFSNQPPPSKNSDIPPQDTKHFGSWGEDLARSFLEKQGLTFVSQNYRCKVGEIDLIFRDKEEWVFVEVKARKTTQYGLPQEAITPKKARKLAMVSIFFLQQQKKEDDEYRIDVIAVSLNPDKSPSIEHIKNAVSYF